MIQRFLPPLSAFLLAASSLSAQTPYGASLTLNGYTPTLSIDASHPPQFTSGELPWSGQFQLAPIEFSLTRMELSEGLPPNAAWAGKHTTSIPEAKASYPSPFWSGYSGEGEAYPNADMAFDLAGAGISQGPLSYNNGVIQLRAWPMTNAESATLPPELSGRGYTSAALNTYPHSQEYGYFEETAQVPAGPGFWAAFWMVPENMNPVCHPKVSCGTEIDVMEILGSNTKQGYAFLHTSDTSSPSYPFYGPGYTVPGGADLSAGMHRYGVDWEPDYITFYLDGVAFYSAKTPSDMHQPMYMIINLGIGVSNTWAGAPTSSTKFPGLYSVEAIRAWASPNSVPMAN